MIGLHHVISVEESYNFWIDANNTKWPVVMLTDQHILNIIMSFRRHSANRTIVRALQVEAVYREYERRNPHLQPPHRYTAP